MAGWWPWCCCDGGVCEWVDTFDAVEAYQQEPPGSLPPPSGGAITSGSGSEFKAWRTCTKTTAVGSGFIISGTLQKGPGGVLANPSAGIAIGNTNPIGEGFTDLWLQIRWSVDPPDMSTVWRDPSGVVHTVPLGTTTADATVIVKLVMTVTGVDTYTVDSFIDGDLIATTPGVNVEFPEDLPLGFWSSDGGLKILDFSFSGF